MSKTSLLLEIDRSDKVSDLGLSEVTLLVSGQPVGSMWFPPDEADSRVLMRLLKYVLNRT